ncbi:hypothetical protein RESH_04027 [Rhodopirellula europaea SH398]|uniref:Uncharacterized protein n=1 Tax=Rhodopirellula europaea SH398 TaxID=1263868 RepID=M5SGU6_9BACT|nr:hypothetical protein RESH_04027 [Rhodopirellula europaea SH398]
MRLRADRAERGCGDWTSNHGAAFTLDCLGKQLYLIEQDQTVTPAKQDITTVGGS